MITSKGASPSPAWERFVVTGKARSRIRRFLRTRQRNDYIAHGRELLQRAAQRERVTLGEKRLESVLEGFHQKSVDDLLAAIGEGSLNGRLVVDALRRDDKPGAPEPDDNVVPLRPHAAGAGAGRAGRHWCAACCPGLAVHFAGCCHPVPGDAIVGVVRTGRGVTIHRSECAHLDPAQRRPRALARSRLELGSGGQQGDRPAAGHDRSTSRAVSARCRTAIGRQGGNITDLRFGTKSPDLYEIILDIEVDDLDHLGRVVAGLRALPVVTHVERSQG